MQNPDFVHVPDGRRRETGHAAARLIDTLIRSVSVNIPWPQRSTKRLCPGCYWLVLFNAAVSLTKANGHSLTEMGEALSGAFARLRDGMNEDGIEEIGVLLDKD